MNEIVLAALAIVSTVVSGVIIGVTVPLVRGVLKGAERSARATEALLDEVRALRGAFAGFGQRLEDMRGEGSETNEMVRELHYDKFGTKRHYAIARPSTPPPASSAPPGDGGRKR